MNKTLLLISVLILSTFVCNAALPQTEPTTVQTISTQPQTQPKQGKTDLPLTEADVPRVSAEEAKIAFDNGKAVIVDVRSAEFYAESHVVGAISIPLDQFENNIENVSLNKEQWIIPYCT